MDRTVDSAVRWHIFKRNTQLALWLLATFWGLTLLAYLFGVFGLVMKHRTTELTASGLTIASSIVTLILAIHSGRHIWRALNLARWGIEVKGTVRAFGGVKDFEPLRRVELTYMHADRAYRKSIWGAAGNWDVGSPLQVIIHPDKPKRCMLRQDVFPPGFDLK